jgi:hypothetical protein
LGFLSLFFLFLCWFPLVLFVFLQWIHIFIMQAFLFTNQSGPMQSVWDRIQLLPRRYQDDPQNGNVGMMLVGLRLVLAFIPLELALEQPVELGEQLEDLVVQEPARIRPLGDFPMEIPRHQ